MNDHGSIWLKIATIDDLATLQRWDEQPHVVESDPNDDWEWEKTLANPAPWREQFIAMLGIRPIGYLEIIDPAADDEHYWGHCGPNLRAIDIWLGEPEDLGKGYGSTMMRLALERCFSDPSVEAILVDPLVENTRAHRFYQRLGFRPVGERRFGLDSCLVHRMERGDFRPE